MSDSADPMNLRQRQQQRQQQQLRPLLLKTNASTNQDIRAEYTEETPSNTLKFIGISLSLCLMIIALALAATALGLFATLPQGFVGLQAGMHVVDTTDEDSYTLVATCTNVTLDTNGTQSFESGTLIKYNCPQSDNNCSSWVCSEIGQCEEQLVTGASCYKNEQCGVSNSCNLNTCICQLSPNSTVGCTFDSECPIVTDRGSCVENLCNPDGVCEETLTLGSTCWFDSQCMPFEYCNLNTCGCSDRPIIPCAASTDCPDISDRGLCAAYDCISNICVEVINGMGQCWFDNQCASDEECDPTTCGCIPEQTGCLDDSDCLDVTDRGGNCSANICNTINGTCVETIINGNCWYNGNCALNEVCDQSNCTCVPAPVFLCQQDVDCPNISDRGDCVSYVCTLGRCVETPVGTCWFDGQCASVEERCDQTICECIPFIIPPCSIDADCPDISDRGSCVAYNCTSGRCNETVLGECWFDGQCGVEQVCDQSTCSCVSITDTCATGYNMQRLPDQLSGLTLYCGIDIAIFRDYACELCLADNFDGSYTYTIISYARVDGEWFWTDYIPAGVTITALPTEKSAKIAMWEDLIVFSGLFSTDPIPQATLLNIIQILSNGLLNSIQMTIVNNANITGACVGIWNTTIVSVAGDAFIYDQTGPVTWTLTQTIEEPNNLTFFDCSIYEENLVLSVRNTSLGYSWIAYLNSGSWMQVGDYLNTVWGGKWYVAAIDNNLETFTGHEFTVVASAADFPISIAEVTSSGGIQYNQPEVVTTTGPGVLSSFNKTWVIGDVLFLNSFTSSMSFQSSFSGFIVTSNDVWNTDPVFTVSSDGAYNGSLSYANYCVV